MRMLYILLLVVFPIFSYSQKESSIVDTSMFDLRRNAVYNEDILIFAYERLLPVSDKFGFLLKGGILIFDPFLPIGEVATVLGGPKHFFESGIGAIPDIFGGGGFITFRTGYRYQAPKGFLFKASAIYSPDNFILPLFTFGYSF